MDSPQHFQESPGQETAGVSRSGRVRKKSSKLTDFFESSDDISPPKKRQSPKAKLKPIKQIEHSNSEESSDSDDDDDDTDDSEDLSDMDNIKDEPVDFENDWANQDEPSDLIRSLKEEYDDEEEEEDDDDEDGVEEDEFDYDYLHLDEDNDSMKDESGFSQAQSLYLSEKKRPSIKDALMKPKKAKRKDKGKSRFTAYMLWAKQVRWDIVQQYPTMDFSAVNKRLGELWALVPTAQKYNWQKKAKRFAAKGEKASRGSMISTGKGKKLLVPQRNTLLNKNNPQQQSVRRGKQLDSRSPTSTNQVMQKFDYQTPNKSTRVPSETTELSPSNTFKVSGTAPIDCAAHLKLLGESLNNIGQKLKEHEGQIAVSGSLSVLLDSMLCVLGPLACLTNDVEELSEAISEETRVNILDNIAYIMPGIV